MMPLPITMTMTTTTSRKEPTMHRCHRDGRPSSTHPAVTRITHTKAARPRGIDPHPPCLRGRAKLHLPLCREACIPPTTMTTTITITIMITTTITIMISTTTFHPDGSRSSTPTAATLTTSTKPPAKPPGTDPPLPRIMPRNPPCTRVNAPSTPPDTEPTPAATTKTNTSPRDGSPFSIPTAVTTITSTSPPAKRRGIVPLGNIAPPLAPLARVNLPSTPATMTPTFPPDGYR
mmetsp:Transcript_23852/g.50072  ORF Transcript_23852/g.50072 Transcript_23852/m.50072 type:complete len:233 (-) Transcript_23852:882-1580(-)